MGCLGGLRAISERERNRLLLRPRAERTVDYLDHLMRQEDGVDLDKAWDAIHRSLSGGGLRFGNQPAPGCWVILGGEVLYGDRQGEEDYILVCKSPRQVRQTDRFLQSLTRKQFRSLYFAIDPAEYGMELSEEDFACAWENLADTLPFWRRAAEQQLWVLFDADQ